MPCYTLVDQQLHKPDTPLTRETDIYPCATEKDYSECTEQIKYTLIVCQIKKGTHIPAIIKTQLIQASLVLLAGGDNKLRLLRLPERMNDRLAREKAPKK